MSEPNEPCSNCENLYKENQELEQRLKTHVQLSHDKTHRIKELEAERDELKAALQNLLAVANAHDCWGEAVEQAQAALKEKE